MRSPRLRMLPAFLFATIIAASQVSAFLLSGGHFYDPFSFHHHASPNFFEPNHFGFFEDAFDDMHGVSNLVDHFWHSPTRYLPFGAFFTEFTHAPSHFANNINARYLPYENRKRVQNQIAPAPANTFRDSSCNARCQTPQRRQYHCPDTTHVNEPVPVEELRAAPRSFPSHADSTSQTPCQPVNQRINVHTAERKYVEPGEVKKDTTSAEPHSRVVSVDVASSRPEPVTLVPRKDSTHAHSYMHEATKHTTDGSQIKETQEQPTHVAPQPAPEPVKSKHKPASTSSTAPNHTPVRASESVRDNKPASPHMKATPKQQNGKLEIEQVRPVVRHQKPQGPNEPHIFRMGIPGFTSRNLHVRGFEEGNHVVVSGKIRCRREDGNSCAPREIKETVSIPAGFDAAKAVAALQRGILTVTVPVKESRGDGFVVVEEVDGSDCNEGDENRVERVTRVETAEDGVTLETLAY